jgi:hypothetical protein
VAGSCKYGDEPADSGATELVCCCYSVLIPCSEKFLCVSCNVACM